MAKELKKGTILKGSAYTYNIEKCLGQGGFGITYYGITKMQGPLGEIDIPVAVKEFFMSDYSERDEATGRVSEPSRDGVIAHYRHKFKVEAQNLAKMKDCPGIVNVLEVFEANNTVYYTMQFVNGQDLDSYIAKQPNGHLAETEAIDIIVRVGEALQFMHEHDLLHLDVKPKNIMMEQSSNKPFLIDFGLSKQYDENGNPESSTNVGGGTAGYSPLEQNTTSGFAPTLDVYALGATLYKCLVGQRPPEAAEVMEDGLPIDKLQSAGVSEKNVSAIEAAMQPRKKDRPQTMAEFVAMLKAECTPSKKVRYTENVGNIEKPKDETTTIDNINDTDDYLDNKKFIENRKSKNHNEQSYSVKFKGNFENEIQSKSYRKLVCALIVSVVTGVVISWFLSRPSESDIYPSHDLIASGAITVEDRKFINDTIFERVYCRYNYFDYSSKTVVVFPNDCKFVGVLSSDSLLNIDLVTSGKISEKVAEKDSMIFGYQFYKYEYVGEVKNDLPNGKGFARFQNGNRYFGNFKDGLMDDSNGRFIVSDGTQKFEVEVRKSKFVKGSVYDSKDSLLFKGEFDGEGNPKW